MRQLLIYSVIFFLQLTFGSSHSLAKVQVDNDVDVYKVIEDKKTNSVSFINPKPEKPTLREIFYYHLIEKPYLDYWKPKVENTVVEDTERPFTNGHGFPFTNDEGLEKNKPAHEEEEETKHVNDSKEKDTKQEDGVKDDQDASTKIEGDSDEKQLETSENNKSKDVNDATDTSIAVERTDSDNKENISESPDANNDNNYERTTQAGDIEDISKSIIGENVESDNNEKDSIAETTTEDITSTSEQTILARYQLFDKIKSKYYEKMANTNPETILRRKRNVDEREIPAAPILPGMEEGIVGRSLKVDAPDDTKQQIKDKIEKMFDEVSKNINEKKTDEDDQNARKPRTYGMTLQDDRGVVWNDLFTKPGVSYSVGNQEPNDGDDEVIIEPFDETKTKEPEDNDKEAITETVEETPANPEDLEDIEVNVDKKKEKPQEEPSSDEKEVEEKTEIEQEDAKTDEVEKEMMPMGKSFIVHNDDTETPKGRSEKRKRVRVIKRRKPVNAHKEESLHNEKDDKSPSKDKKDEDLHSLLDNKQFWEWLGDWTSVYMEVFIQNVGNIIKEEIKKQMEVLSKENSLTVSESHTNENELKRRHHKGDKKDKVDTNKEISVKNTTDGKPVTVSSDKMYGNSVGNEKVTNVFIFYPNEKGDKIIEDLKPLLNEAGQNPGDKENETIVIDKTNFASSEKDKKTDFETSSKVPDKEPVEETENADAKNESDKKIEEITEKTDETEKTSEPTTEKESKEVTETTSKYDNESKEPIDKIDVTSEDSDASVKSTVKPDYVAKESEEE